MISTEGQPLGPPNKPEKPPVVPKGATPKEAGNAGADQAKGHKKAEKGVPAAGVLFVGEGAPGKTPDKENKLRKLLFQALDELAGDKFGKKSFGELNLTQKLSTLETYLQHADDVSDSTKTAIGKLKAILEREPDASQLKDMKAVFAELPFTDEYANLEAEVQMVLRHNAAGYAMDNGENFHLSDGDISKFALDVGDMSVGATQMDPLGFNEVIPGITDKNLQDYLTKKQKGIDLADYSTDNPRDCGKFIGVLEEMQNDIVNGAISADGKFDPDQAKEVIGTIKKQIEALEDIQSQFETDFRKAVGRRGDKELPSPTSAEELIDRLNHDRNFNADAATEVYEHNLHDEEKDLFKAYIQEQIRKKISILNSKGTPWRVGGSIDRDSQELDHWLKMLSEIDPEHYEIMHTETEARSWLFHMYDTLSKGASPMDTKDLAHPMQEFDKAEYWNSIAKLPGVSEATMLLEQHYDDILAAETNPTKQKHIFEKIIHEVEQNENFLKNAGGMKAKDAVETAHHFFHARLRDAQRYQLYMEKNHLVKIVYKDGHPTYSVDPKAPQLWNSFRLALYPQAMWSFFQFGSDMRGAGEGAGKPLEFKFRNSAGNYETKAVDNPRMIKMGAGVGANVYEAFIKYNFSTNFTDFDSRRLNGYIIPAWITERMQHEKDLLVEFAQQTPDTIEKWKEKHEDYSEANAAQWQREHAEYESGGDAAAMYTAKKAVEFCVIQGIPVPQGRLEELKKMVHEGKVGAASLLAQAESMGGTKFKNGSCEVLTDMSHYDISKVPYNWMLRLQEGFRGNYRDTFSALGVADVMGKFIVDPTLENFEKIDWHMMVGYATPFDAMQYMVLPAYLALIDVNKHPFMGFGKSLLGQVRDVPAMSRKELYEVGLWAVSKGGLSPQMLREVRGRFAGLVIDKANQDMNLLTLTVLTLALLAELKNQVDKDSKGD